MSKMPFEAPSDNQYLCCGDCEHYCLRRGICDYSKDVAFVSSSACDEFKLREDY